MTERQTTTDASDMAKAFRDRIDRAPMSRVQIRAIGIIFLLSALDGYDLLAMSFAAQAWRD